MSSSIRGKRRLVSAPGRSPNNSWADCGAATSVGGATAGGAAERDAEPLTTPCCAATGRAGNRFHEIEEAIDGGDAAFMEKFGHRLLVPLSGSPTFTSFPVC